MSTKKQFDPNFRDLPSAFLTETKKGKKVYRIRLSTAEILDCMEKGNTQLSIDLICDRNGALKPRTGTFKGKTWSAINFYGWAVPEPKKA